MTSSFSRLRLAHPAPEPRYATQAQPRPARERSTAYLDADRARISITVPRRVLDKLAAARDALAHVIPEGNLADVLEHALDLVLAESRRKRALVAKPRSGSKPPKHGSRHVPAKVARAVWTRSGGRCECVLPDGERCEVTRALEIDHIRPFALGGEPTEENLRIACRGCNQLAARRAFGDAVMDVYARRKVRARSAPAPHEPATRRVATLAGPPAPSPLQHALFLLARGSAP